MPADEVIAGKFFDGGAAEVDGVWLWDKAGNSGNSHGNVDLEFVGDRWRDEEESTRQSKSVIAGEEPK